MKLFNDKSVLTFLEPSKFIIEIREKMNMAINSLLFVSFELCTIPCSSVLNWIYEIPMSYFFCVLYI